MALTVIFTECNTRMLKADVERCKGNLMRQRSSDGSDRLILTFVEVRSLGKNTVKLRFQI